MKTNILFITGLLLVLFFTGCEKELDEVREQDPAEDGSGQDGNSTANVPEGYFVVNFTPNAGDVTRAPITGSDVRIRNLRYLIYNSSSMFVKEKVVLSTTGSTNWPLTVVSDTLPKGSYTAVFLGNVEKTLFPYAASRAGQAYSDVLTNYKGLMADARIVLPKGSFSDHTEYYWAKVPFSDAAPQPNIVLQRVIGMFKVHRNFVDAQMALDTLTNHVVTNLNAKNIISNQVNAVLPGAVRAALNQPGLSLLWGTITVGFITLDQATANVLAALVTPVTNALYQQLLDNIVHQLGGALTGNSTHQGAIDGLGVLLNPWNDATARTAVVTLRNFPKTMDFDLTVKETYVGNHYFQYDFTPASIYAEKDIQIRGLNGFYDVRKIRVSSNTLIGGVLVDDVIDDSILLNSVFVNISDSVQARVISNKRYKSDYSFVDLNYKSGTGTQPLQLSVRVGDIANIDNALNNVPIVGPLLTGVLSVVLLPLHNITVTVPLNVPILGADKLTLSGSWSPSASY